MTDNLKKMRALTTIESASDEVTATGQVDADGVPVFAREPVIIPRGTTFMATPEQRDELLRSGAAEEVEQ